MFETSLMLSVAFAELSEFLRFAQHDTGEADFWYLRIEVGKMNLPFEQFPALSAIGICRHVFIQRIPGIDVSHDKAEVLERLDAAHREIRNATGFGDWPLFTAEQIHGNNIAVIDSCSRGPVGREFPGVRWHYHQSTRCRARHLRRGLLRSLHRRSKNACDWPCAFRPQRNRAWRRHKRDQTND